jgi:hypothetical protein
MFIDQSRVDIATLLSRIRSNDLDLQPEFQRGLVWPDTKKVRLIDTILRNWYIPAIHLVVNEELDREEVLDGQQRLQAMIDFLDGNFAVDGSTLPLDPEIRALDGLKYDQLPNRYKSRFKRFPIDTVRLRDYRAEEPGELFFRLNQITALTAAEQRNALIGKPRNQIKALVRSLEEKVGAALVGFSNVRLNYDDTLSRLAVAIEENSLAEKTTAAGLERRYRVDLPFSSFVIGGVEGSIETLGMALREARGAVRLNRASLFSWLFFYADNGAIGSPYLSAFTDYLGRFEYARGNVRSANRGSFPIEMTAAAPALQTSRAKAALEIFNDRSSSRVNDTSSVLLRDYALNYCFYSLVSRRFEDDSSRSRWGALKGIAGLLDNYHEKLDLRLEREAAIARDWEEFRALGRD